jgi:hypothetical protein
MSNKGCVLDTSTMRAYWIWLGYAPEAKEQRQAQEQLSRRMAMGERERKLEGKTVGLQAQPAEA